MELNLFGFKLNQSSLIILFLVLVIAYLVMYRCVSCVNVKEGFAPIDYQMGQDVSTSSLNWKNAMNTTGNGASAHQATAPAAALEQGQLFMFDDTTFSPDCCPSDYSSSTGCACTTKNQMSFLNERGGNRTMASIY
jgi:hypothetical protein